MKTKTMYGFEAKVDGQWSAEACGEQDVSNYLKTRAAAEAELPNLARVLSTNGDEVSVSDLRVVAVSVSSGA